MRGVERGQPEVEELAGDGIAQVQPRRAAVEDGGPKGEFAGRAVVEGNEVADCSRARDGL
jgi:hypothetical protein